MQTFTVLRSPLSAADKRKQGDDRWENPKSLSRDLCAIPARLFDQERRKFERNTMNAKKGRCEAFSDEMKMPLNKKQKKN